MHPLSHAKYPIGHKVPFGLTGGGPGTVIARSVTEGPDGDLTYRYLVESRVWPCDPLKCEWWEEERLDAYEELRIKHERELRHRLRKPPTLAEALEEIQR